RTLHANPTIVRLLVRLFKVRLDPALDGNRDAEASELGEQVTTELDAGARLDADRILRSLARRVHGALRAHCIPAGAPAEPGPPSRAKAGRLVKAGPGGQPGAAAAQAGVRDLGLLAPVRGGAPAVRDGGPWRAALVRPPGGLPHRDPRPGQGADGEERGDRPG